MLRRIRVLLKLSALYLCIFVSAVGSASAPHRGDSKCVVEDMEGPIMPACVVDSRKGILYIAKQYWMYPNFNQYGLSPFTITSFGRVYINRTGRIVIRDVAFMDNAPDEFHHGLVRINRGKFWGYSDPSGKIVVPVKYSCALNLKDDYNNIGPLVCVGCRTEQKGDYRMCLGGKWFQTNIRGQLTPAKSP